MVATWNPAAASTYYTRQRETQYYAGSHEPPGVWFAPAGDFCVVDGAPVERRAFERLYHAIGDDGKPLLEKVRLRKERTPAFDVTLSAPRSVALVWAFASYETKLLIEAAQQQAARTTLTMLEREAVWARRGRDGKFLEKVPLTSAAFQHGESRPTAHIDGRVFADPNLHTHCVLMNIATRPSDLTVGGLHSKIIRDFKMVAGATYHAALAHELEKIGFSIDRIGKNGICEIAGVDDKTIRYFSARRQEIEAGLAEHGVVSGEAPALAGAVAKATRSAKRQNESVRREDVWSEAARSIGIDVKTFTEHLRDQAKTFDREASERLLSERLAALPAALTEQESVVERRELLRSVTAALVGTRLPAERAEAEVSRLLRDGTFLEIGRDSLGLPCYSTPEMLAIEREVVDLAQHLTNKTWHAVDQERLTSRCKSFGLSTEQTEAALAATSISAISLVEGAPGSGKTTTLNPVVESYLNSGCKVIGTATAWRIANMLRDDLGIEARATASWIERLKSGEEILDNRTVLIADEAGLLSSRQMHVLLSAVAKAGAKLILVGDRRQLQAIGGPGLSLVSRAVEAARIDSIVRQPEAWARDAITSFGRGQAAAALEAFAEHNLLMEANGAKSAISAIIAAADQARALNPDGSCLILAKTNAAVTAISKEIRERQKSAGIVTGKEIVLRASTPSGHTTEIALARGDQIRFLIRNDALKVVNGTIGTVTKVSERRGRASGASRIRIEAEIAGRRVAFDPTDLADGQGRTRIGWAYASTIYGSQGLTVDTAVVYLDPSCNRHDVFVAVSRGRAATLVVDSKSIDRRLSAELPFDQQREGAVFSDAQRRRWLAERLSRASTKMSTLDVIDSVRPIDGQTEQVRQRRRELGHEL